MPTEGQRRKIGPGEWRYSYTCRRCLRRVLSPEELSGSIYCDRCRSKVAPAEHAASLADLRAIYEAERDAD